jgi:replicative DNA helicase
MSTTARKSASNGEILDARPPADLESEAAVIGSIFLNPNAIDDVSLLLERTDFYDQQLGVIYGHLLDMHHAGKRIDMRLFAAHVKKAGGEVRKFREGPRHPASVDSVVLSEAMQSTPTAANASHYASLVREQAIKRELKLAGQMIIASAHNEPDAFEALDKCEREILTIRDHRGTATSQIKSVMEVLAESMAEIDKRSSDNPPWLSTGFIDLDRLMGFRPGRVTILAARTSMGKTALALNFATNAARSGASVLFFSLEMDSLEIGDRILSSLSGVDGLKMQSGNLTSDERRAIVEASAEYSQFPLHIDDGPVQSMQSISAVCRRHKRKHGLDLVIVDYLQLVSADNSRDPREQQVAKISKRLKVLARELEVPVLCLAQLNRQSETSRDNRPRLAHLRESGAIEQDADVVAFVHRPEYYETEPAEKERLKGKAEIYVEKNRGGPTGMAKLAWFANTVTFRNLAVSDMDNYQPGFAQYNQSEAF